MASKRCKELVVPRKGRCLVASTALAPGTDVLRCKGDAWALYAAERGSVCAYCLDRPDKPPKKCMSCKVMRYCSRKCQSADWAQHRQECKSLARLSPTVPGPSLLVAARLLRRVLVEASESEGGMQGGQLYASLEQLLHHEEALTEDRRLLMLDMASLVREILQDDPGIDPQVFAALQPEYVVRLICRLGCNAITVTDDECIPIGIGLFLGMVSLNHSCRPNCFALFEGPVLRIRTIEEVAPGAELTIAYIDVAGPKAERQKELRDGYHFECSCIRCQSPTEAEQELLLGAWLCPSCGGACVEKVDEAEMYMRWRAGLVGQEGGEAGAPRPRVCVQCGQERPDAEAVRKRLAEAEKWDRDALEMYKDGQLEGAIRFYKKAYAVYESVLVPRHYLRQKQAHRLASLHIGMQDWKVAREYSRASIDCLEHILPPSSPIPALEHLLLGKLEWYLDEPDLASAHLRAALQTLRVTHGSDHRLVAVALGLFQEVEAARGQAEKKEFR